MRLNGGAPTLTHDVLHLDVTCDERVRQQHPVALPPHRLGTHHGDVARCAELQKLRDRGAEIRRQHVIGVPAKCLVAPRAVWRIRPWLAQPPSDAKWRYWMPSWPRRSASASLPK